MNAAQLKLYWWQFASVRAYYRGRGLTADQIEERRKAIHRKALGSDKSATTLTSAEFDKVKAAFRAIWDGSNLDAQLEFVGEADERKQSLLDRCFDQVTTMHALGDDRLRDDAAREGYIGGTARNVVKKDIADCSERELAVVLGCLERRVGVLRRRNPEAAAALDAKRNQEAF
ncbi:hypothetical protein [Opitutus sp. ER46]|uniref:hypothetical protein n=1 Tax=Opitutus sp. ER46 TaxID=2161864 RepID=UPI000D31C586|nr:hypothetical protein [Opitutus sp. ER46]PTX95738.1 hypothetical protein DB354_10025 [Opitutus sp. ER46]